DAAQLVEGFSIHYRIELAATVKQQIIKQALLEFQYPLPDRISCNHQQHRDEIAKTMFQYPLPDRISCNFGNIARLDSNLLGFQYPLPDRISCNPLGDMLPQMAQCMFQYPLPDRISCN